MRRLFVLFLLVLLPFQSAFAAAAPYCALEKVAVAFHFGHHEHPDTSAPEPEPVDNGDVKVHECGVCHLNCGQVHPASASIGALPALVAVVALADTPQPQHLQEPTERPPRTSLA